MNYIGVKLSKNIKCYDQKDILAPYCKRLPLQYGGSTWLNNEKQHTSNWAKTKKHHRSKERQKWNCTECEWTKNQHVFGNWNVPNESLSATIEGSLG